MVFSSNQTSPSPGSGGHFSRVVPPAPSTAPAPSIGTHLTFRAGWLWSTGEGMHFPKNSELCGTLIFMYSEVSHVVLQYSPVGYVV